MNATSKSKVFFNSLKTVVLTVIFFVLVTIALIAFTARFNLPGGFRAYSVLTGSMEPVIQTGSLIFTKSPSSTAEIQKNEVITFEEPGYENKFITHRVSQVVNANPGVVYKTKGDANSSEDPWLISYGRIKGVYLAHLPYAGSLLEFIKTPLGIVLFVVIPVSLIIIDESKNLISALVDIKIEKEKRRNSRESTHHNYIWLLLIPLIGLGVGQTKALFLSNKAILSNNKIATTFFSSAPSINPSPSPSASTPNPSSSFTPSTSPSIKPSFSPSPTPSSSPSPSASGTVIIISGNGSGSNNSSEVSSSTNCQSNQENNANIDINISSNSTSGGNNNSGNTGGNSATNTGNSSTSVNVSVTGGNNSSNSCP